MRLFTPLFLFLFVTVAQAQFQVALSLPKTNFLALESIPATVTITNRSGAEVVLGGPGRASWLSFEMTDRSGTPLAPMEVSGVELVQIPQGGTIQRRIVVTDAYAPTEVGNYGLTARVAHSPSGQYYKSERVRFNISEVKPMWEQMFGVPEGFRDAGAARKYAVLLFDEIGSTSLYARIVDEKTKLRLQTLRLGPVTMARDPQITMDRQNQLHVLFLAQPHIYTYCIMAPDGTLKKRAYYMERDNNHARLVVNANGDATIQGGEWFDPTQPMPTPEKGTGRGVSERPPGLN